MIGMIMVTVIITMMAQLMTMVLAMIVMMIWCSEIPFVDARKSQQKHPVDGTVLANRLFCPSWEEHPISHIYSPRTKWPPFWQTTSSNAFSWMQNEKFCIFIKISLKFVPRSLNWQYPSIGLYNGLAPKRRQAIIWTNADTIHWRIYETLGWNHSKSWCFIRSRGSHGVRLGRYPHDHHRHQGRI